MSFNLSTKLNNLYQVVENIQTTALTNPMVANLNMASYSINNATSVNAPASTPITITADPAQGLVINTKVSIPNHPLTITNNTTNDSLIVADSLGDTNVFRVDTNGNVAVKSNPSASLTNDFTVNGNTAITGNLTATNITATNVSAGNVINNITAGNGILKTGTAQNPTITANLTAGSGITITPSAGALQISASSSSSSSLVAMAYNLNINPDATVGNALRVVPIIATPGVSLSSLGINPANYNYIEVSMGFDATCQLNSNYYTFYALGNDGSIGSNALGDSIYYADTSARAYYARFIMDKSKGHFTNATTSINMIKDDSFAPFPNGFILAFNLPYLTMMVRAFN